MMRTTPRRRRPIARVESLETRNLLTSLAVASPIATPQPPIIVAPPVAPTPSTPPTVAFVQFEPLTGRILVSYTGDLSGYNNATLTNPANYRFTPITTKQKLDPAHPTLPGQNRSLSPTFQVTGVQLSTPVAPGQAQSLIVSVDNNLPIKFGTYRFTILGAGISDNAGKTLDGSYSGVFPSGNGQAGSNFVADLTETHSTILPADPVTSLPAPPTPGEIAPSYVFVPSTRPVNVRYLAARPAVFQLAGGNNIRLEALRYQFFPGTYRAPATKVPFFAPTVR